MYKYKPALSFEFFPARTDQGAQGLMKTVRDLAALDPVYMTVTFGAGGGGREGTLETLKALQSVTDVPLGSHLTYICLTKAELSAYLETLWAGGVKHIVALRGDMPKDQADVKWPLDPDLNYYQYTSDFVEGIRAQHPFEISVGAYPEKHPDAPSLESDIEALKKKCDAGATRAITQFFFNNDSYYRFLDKVRAAGISTPVVPGILPVYDFKGMLKFAKNCHAHVPPWVHEKFDGLDGRPEEALKIAEGLLTAQCRDLMDHDVPHFHFYTMNKPELPLKVCKTLGF
ncbi:MAG: methylenetetrahydrofolate reductase [NAD(P)H] [Rhodospirillales bacterium]|nr:methylenetetrahydrofolate reductase [NAD(P)H] [Alphaproteobacteria bacterium]USO03945.1 MAG: methylenetetrahydrofolate reductase [NAD(P)H] [Rhodospirillales bacterium]